MPSIVRKVNPDVAKERQTATFDVEEFASWWHGGAEKLKEKREIEEEVFDDPKLQDEVPVTYLSYQEMYNQTIKKCTYTVRKLQEIQERRNPGGEDIFPRLFAGPIGEALHVQNHPLLLHYTMFVPTIKEQGTPEQVEKWLPRALKCNIIGTYAQTELGHGTFLRGLETRADYDSDTEEFVLHSPTLTAYKWWPGALGHTANYAIVVAQLHIKDQSYGVQMFIVQLRDEETHMPLPGIKVGEIGDKMAYQAVNNGYLGFNKYRIPRLNMLMRYAQVQPDGTFQKSPMSVLVYFTMVRLRVKIVMYAYQFLLKSATIATRYAAVRRQSVINPKEPEHQILDYVTQQLKLFPQLAKGLVFKLISNHLDEMFCRIQEELLNGDFERLPEMHALTCCLKAVCSKDSTAGIEVLRLACGGHGFLIASHLPTFYCFETAMITYEGENTVMLLQTARYLMKAWHKALQGEKLVQTVAYLGEAVKSNEFAKWDGSWQCLIKALQFTAANKIRLAFNHLEARKNQDMTPQEASNCTSIELFAAAELHGRSFLAATALEQLNSKASERSDELNAVLYDLLELYLVNACLEQMNHILRFITLTEKDVHRLENRLENVLKKIRPNAVAIVDGLNYHDRELNSVLGSYDGNVYERIFEAAQQCPMNKISVQKSFHEYLKPFMKSNI